MTATPTLLEWAGGTDVLRDLFDAFYDLVESDDLLSPYFGGQVSGHHREAVVRWWTEVFGGPADYSERDGGYPHMISQHIGLGITRAHRARFIALLIEAADATPALPDDPEFRSALMAYAEWGTQLARINSQPGAAVVLEAPVPRWGWGEAPPYRPDGT